MSNSKLYLKCVLMDSLVSSYGQKPKKQPNPFFSHCSVLVWSVTSRGIDGLLLNAYYDIKFHLLVSRHMKRADGSRINPDRAMRALMMITQVN